MLVMKTMPAVLCAAVLACAVVSQAAEQQKPVFFRNVPGAPRSAEEHQENEVASAGLRIYNGDVASRKQFPYQAAIYIDLDFFCGGSLIDENWVLTAAHCVEGGNIWYVLLGVTESITPQQDGRRTYVTRGGIRHPDYDSDYIINDIGLVQLMRPATLSDFIQTIPLTPKNKVYIGSLATVSGFGRTDDTSSSPISSVLRYASLPVVKNEVCSSAYGRTTGADPSVICLSAEGTSSCKGDSGGPLVLQDDDNNWFQIGTVSFGASAGCTKGYPVGYGNVSLFIDWISETTAVNFSS